MKNNNYICHAPYLRNIIPHSCPNGVKRYGGREIPFPTGRGGLEILLGEIFFTGGDLHKEFFSSFEAFVMLKLIFHIY